MIKGIGIDIIELSRVEDVVNRTGKLVDRILTPSERDRFETLAGRRQVEFLAGRFAAKEAFSKAMGTGIGKDLSFLDIEIAVDPLGKPVIVKPDVNAHLSISHSRDYAVAQVVIESD
ncbi:holo-ACP synthase [Neobacillus massiliamazoniensis]|jgi:holo-[acyl-carrier protein] synthase|uniref:Holo-[acyl-carrier-protein] synthase n=1 Tax=Neobacillus massiliamazoniensis TaxID=1499688 RepID=A0A0U1P482_9BACI|nr:holo-ACP synthase [Neobacillus massiliamazoniensis]CRK85129.1 4'-phosphopantetheinyl transferase [Neobacillus massiliamazoniensis]